MVKRFFILFWNTLVFFVVASAPSFSQEKDQPQKPWFDLEMTLFDSPELQEKIFVFKKAVCNYDEDGGTLCFEMVVQNACYILYVFYSPLDDGAYVLKEDETPFLRVDTNRQADMTTFEDLQEKFGRLGNNGFVLSSINSAIWMTQIGNPSDFFNSENGLYKQLLSGEKLNIFIPLADGNYHHNSIHLSGIDPFLKQMAEGAFESAWLHGPCGVVKPLE